MLNVTVLVSGGGTNLQAIMDAIDAGEIQNARITHVISNNPRAYALERAAKAGIQGEVLSPKSYDSRAEFNEAFLARLQEINPDLIVLAGFLVVIPEAVVKAFPYKLVNIHPSLIPSFCGTGFYGLHVHEKALEYGVKVSGATVHFVSEECDGGPIVLQKAVYVEEGDTPEILQRRIMEQAEWVILPRAVALFCQGKLRVEGRTVHILK